MSCSHINPLWEPVSYAKCQTNLESKDEYDKRKHANDDWAKKNCANVEYLAFQTTGAIPGTCLAHRGVKLVGGKIVEVGAPVADALKKDLGVPDILPSDADEKKRKAALKNYRTNLVKVEEYVIKMITLQEQFMGIMAKESEQILKKDYDQWMSSLKKKNDEMSTILKQIEAIKKQGEDAKDGWLDYIKGGYFFSEDGYADEITPALEHAKSIYLECKDIHDIRIPNRITFDKREPFHVRDSEVDYYKAKIKFETECKKNFEDLSTMNVLVEGCDFSNDAKRKLQAVASCTSKSEFETTYPANAQKYIDKARECQSNSGLIFLLGGIFVVYFIVRAIF